MHTVTQSNSFIVKSTNSKWKIDCCIKDAWKASILTNNALFATCMHCVAGYSTE